MATKIKTGEGRFTAPCQVCNQTRVGDYIKYRYLGFELMFMICGDCFMYINAGGLAALKMDVAAAEEMWIKYNS